MFAGVPVADKVMAKVARHLAGLGLLPDQASVPGEKRPDLRVPVAIVGGGAAGLGAAEALSRRGVPFYLCERETFLGGQLAVGAPVAAAPAIPRPESWPNAQVELGATAIGLYEDAAGQYLGVTSRGPEGAPRLLKVYAQRFLLAAGGRPAVLPFENNDLPGVYAGRAVSRLLRRHSLLPGETLVVVGHGTELLPLVDLLRGAGAKVARVIDTAASAPYGEAQSGEVLRAHGLGKVSALTYQPTDGGAPEKVACDGIVVSLPVTPAFELARQGGVSASFSAEHGTFVVNADEDGRTARENLFVAGDARGALGPNEAYASGAHVARALTAGLT
jgi:sarcosine oxidase subunit alpha